MLSCKAFLMNYCWHSVQRLEGSSPREEKADSLLCLLSAGPTQDSHCMCWWRVWGLHIPSASPPRRARDRLGFITALGSRGVRGQVATHSSVLTWEIPWTGEPGGLQSMVSGKNNQTQLSNYNRKANPRPHPGVALLRVRTGFMVPLDR